MSDRVDAASGVAASSPAGISSAKETHTTAGNVAPVSHRGDFIGLWLDVFMMISEEVKMQGREASTAHGL